MAHDRFGETGPTMFVASSGGHLTQMIDLADRFAPDGRAVWVTFDTDQARSALEGRAVEYVPSVPPRGYRALAVNVPTALRLLRRHRPRAVVSTGSGIALAFLPAARLVGASALYVESATRADGPSYTGRLLARVPWVQTRTQHPGWADARWRFEGSVFDGFRAEEAPRRPLRRVVVTLGTMETYGFRRLVERLAKILPPDVEVLWQTGATDVTGLDLDVRVSVPADELEAAMAEADLVIAHAGTGTALTCLRLGRRPLLVPREHAHGEHVDDHQAQTASYLAELGLATVIPVDELELDDVEAAAAWVVRRNDAAPPLRLGA
jgi:UDP-N-acetylglucosamine--N-acetylmuramyl-(pentapeptide) pyrophosphoryl-undecaprenol N-acetylglucosamine transferase